MERSDFSDSVTTWSVGEATRMPEVAARFDALVSAWHVDGAMTRPPSRSLDEEQKDQLRALGCSDH